MKWSIYYNKSYTIARSLKIEISGYESVRLFKFPYIIISILFIIIDVQSFIMLNCNCTEYFYIYWRHRPINNGKYWNKSFSILSIIEWRLWRILQILTEQLIGGDLYVGLQVVYKKSDIIHDINMLLRMFYSVN